MQKWPFCFKFCVQKNKSEIKGNNHIRYVFSVSTKMVEWNLFLSYMPQVHSRFRQGKIHLSFPR